MPAGQPDQDAIGQARPNNENSVQYPTNHVVAILDTQDQTTCAVDALVRGGFFESEVELLRGNEEADRLAGGTGRRGFLAGVSSTSSDA